MSYDDATMMWILKFYHCCNSYFHLLQGEAKGVQARCPYKLVKDGHVVVTGLPEGVPFKTPSSYGVPMLKKVLDSRDKLVFSCKSLTEVFFKQAG